VLYSFSGGADGRFPIGGLIRDGAGNLYGTTAGGEPGGSASALYSSWIRLATRPLCTPSRAALTALPRLEPCSAMPVATCTAHPKGGIPRAQCAGENSGNGCGTVFKVDPSGHETVLYSFTGGSDGSIPVVGLIRDAAGDFYGTASAGVIYRLALFPASPLDAAWYSSWITLAPIAFCTPFRRPPTAAHLSRL